MFSKLFFSRQTAPAAEPVVEAEPVGFREDFTLEVDSMTVTQILNELRCRTIEFSERYELAWAATDFVVHNVPVRVKLTENQDVFYFVDGDLFFNAKDAVAAVKNSQIQF